MDIQKIKIEEAEVFRMSILLTGDEAKRAKKRLTEAFGGIPLREIFGKLKKKLPEAVQVEMPEKLREEILSGKTSLKSEAELFAEKNLNPEYKNDVRRLPRIMYKKGSYLVKVGGAVYYWVDKAQFSRFEKTNADERFLSPAGFSDTVHSEHLYFLAKQKLDAEFPVSR